MQRCAIVSPFLLRMVHHPKGHPANFTELWEVSASTWASIPAERFLPCRVRRPQRIEAILRTKGEGLPNILYTV
jgi:hypothetical protein